MIVRLMMTVTSVLWCCGKTRAFSLLPQRRLTTTKSLQRRSVSALSSTSFDYDVIVIGGGHAGCEAATAAARTGAKTALVTQKLHTVGELSCNPSIGGIGKGHLVREIDALGGVMGDIADQAGIHFRVLNRRKGPAVRGPRAQMDRDLYQAAMQETLHDYPNLQLVEASAQDFMLDELSGAVGGPLNLESLAPMASLEESSTTTLLGQKTTDDLTATQKKLMQSTVSGFDRQARIRGVVVEKSDGTREEISARAVVVTTGTFLRGVLMMGHERYAGGRHLRDSEKVEAPSVGLAQTLENYQFPLSRLKTGTPARIDGTTIDWDVLQIQPSEVPAQPFSHVRQFNVEQPPNVEAGRLINCFQTATNEETHKLVLEYEHTLPLYDGMEGKGNGPRYCPSIYKKVQRFPDRNRHNCFLEPEGLDTDIVYPNGMSGPYPPEIQEKILRTMKGLGAVEIVRPGYDVEYDFVNPQALTHTMETKKIGGLYLAGQICGTTGYEEAGAQGIVAGCNAGRAAVAASRGDKPPLPFVLGRDEGYIGVLIDDLVTRGTSEPYRMFTSRAEYRITLRADNADLRLTRKGASYGLVQDEERLSALDARECLIEDGIEKLRKFDLKVTEWAERGSESMGGSQMNKRKVGQRKTAEEVLVMPHVTLKEVESVMEQVASESGDNSYRDIPDSVFDTVEASIKYDQYVRRQHKDMESWRRAQGLRIPPDVVYDRENLPTLSGEELEKLSVQRPQTFAEASAISGITPQALVYLYHHVQGRNRARDGKTKKRVEVNH